MLTCPTNCIVVKRRSRLATGHTHKLSVGYKKNGSAVQMLPVGQGLPIYLLDDNIAWSIFILRMNLSWALLCLVVRRLHEDPVDDVSCLCKSLWAMSGHLLSRRCLKRQLIFPSWRHETAVAVLHSYEVAGRLRLFACHCVSCTLSFKSFIWGAREWTKWQYLSWMRQQYGEERGGLSSWS